MADDRSIMATEHIVAKENTIVHDPVMDIDRQIIAGQPVPPDLIEAYREKTGDEAVTKSQGEDARDDLHAKPPADAKDDAKEAADPAPAAPKRATAKDKDVKAFE